MIGLGRDASYQAAKKGQIPTVDMGHLKIVPRIRWLRILGAESELKRETPADREIAGAFFVFNNTATEIAGIRTKGIGRAAGHS